MAAPASRDAGQFGQPSSDGLAVENGYLELANGKTSDIPRGAIDSDPAGYAEIPRLGEWNLAGSSRGGIAAIYDRAKWEKFQRTKANSMGIQW